MSSFYPDSLHQRFTHLPDLPNLRWIDYNNHIHRLELHPILSGRP